MIESIPWTALVDVGASGLVVVVVLMIFTGRLVPVVFYRTLAEQKEHWRKAAETLRETNAIQAKTIEKQTVVGDTVVRVMSAVQDASDEGRQP